MFWGLIMEPFKRYSQTVEKAFHISNAALDGTTGDNEVCQVMVGSQGKDFLVCTLQKGKVLQTPLDLYFKEGSEISFTTSGKCVVHLTGYLDPELYEDEEGEESESDLEEEDVPSLIPIDKKKRKADFSPDVPNNKKQRKEQKKKAQKQKAESSDESDDESDDGETDLAKLLADDESDANDESYVPNDTINEVSVVDSDDDDDEEDDDEDDEDDDSEEEQPTPQVSPVKEGKNKKDKKADKPQQNGTSEKKNKAQNKENEQKPSKQQKPAQDEKVVKEKKVLAGNVAIEDLKVGQGGVAKPGKMVQVYYEGRLKSDNKMFDSCLKGPGFKFKLGKKEVIPGWDIGVAGMKIGGKRRIICPPGMAYGKKGSPPVIPPNSTLVFEVELKGVN